MNLRSATIAALLSLCACEAPEMNEPEAPPGRPFDHALVHGTALDLRITANGLALPGVRVTLRAPASEGELAPGVLWQGITDAAGRARGTVSLRSDQTEAQLVLQRAGYRGPYDDESLRTQHGYFAPSSWRTVRADALGDLRVAFSEEAR